MLQEMTKIFLLNQKALINTLYDVYKNSLVFLEEKHELHWNWVLYQ